MSSLNTFNILKCVIVLLLADTVLSNCSNFKWMHTGHNSYAWCITGEWRIINCTANENNNVDATLWFNSVEKSIDGERIKVVSKNVFNITDLQRSDMGKYYCKACNKTKTPLRINVQRGTPFAIPEITKRPNSSVVKYESTVTLECSVKGSYYDYEMLWFKAQSKDGGHIRLKSRSKSTWSAFYKNKVQSEILKITKFRQKNEGQYFCQVRRYAVGHIGRTFVELNLEKLSKPVLSNFTRNGKMFVMEHDDHVVNYQILGTPPPEIAWYKSVDGKEESVPIAKCSCKTNKCSAVNYKDVKVTMDSFVIKNISYLRHHNVTYICRADNVKGHDEQKFTMFVKTKPRLAAPKSEIQLHKENLPLHCMLSKDVNPKNMSYSWAYCDKDVNKQETCESNVNWLPIKSEKNNVLHILENQEGGIRLYRCTAENGIYSDQLIWTIVRPIGQDIPNSICDNVHMRARLKSENEDKNSTSSSIDSVVIWQGIVVFLAILLLVTLFLTFHRRNQKPSYNTCVLPLDNEKIGERV